MKVYKFLKKVQKQAPTNLTDVSEELEMTHNVGKAALLVGLVKKVEDKNYYKFPFRKPTKLEAETLKEALREYCNMANQRAKEKKKVKY